MEKAKNCEIVVYLFDVLAYVIDYKRDHPKINRNLKSRHFERITRVNAFAYNRCYISWVFDYVQRGMLIAL